MATPFREIPRLYATFAHVFVWRHMFCMSWICRLEHTWSCNSGVQTFKHLAILVREIPGPCATCSYVAVWRQYYTYEWYDITKNPIISCKIKSRATVEHSALDLEINIQHIAHCLACITYIIYKQCNAHLHVRCLYLIQSNSHSLIHCLAVSLYLMLSVMRLLSYTDIMVREITRI